MKSTTTEAVMATDPEFPCLMVGTEAGLIVLFHKEGKGTVVGYLPSATATRRPLGYYSETWYMPKFKRFHGSIELSN